MTADPLLSDPKHLLTEDRFLRGLARGLLRDAQDADEVVQDAWVAAMTRPPRAALTLRAWLRTVVRNLVASRRAGDAARRRREQVAARPESVPSADEVRAREAMRREVVEHVLALPEPYRTAVLLRWFEDLTPRAIAARLGVPSTTVRTRLYRALEMLRSRLDEGRSGNQRAWCLALIPLARPNLAGATAVLGGGALFAGSVVMKKVFVGVLVVLVLVSGAGILWVLDVAGVRGTAHASPAPTVGGGNDLRSATPVEVDSSSRRTEALADAVAGDPAATAAPGSGQLLFADGAPAANVAWWLEPGRRLPPREGFLEDRGPHAAMRSHPTPGFPLRTAADGSFPLATPSAAGVLWCEPTTGVRVGFPVAATGTGAAAPLVLRLPELADLAVTCAGLGPQDRWKALVHPAVEEEDGEWNFGHCFVRLLDPVGGRSVEERLAVELDAQFVDATGPAPAVVHVLAGAPYHVSVEAETFSITTPGAVQRAPARVRFETGAQLFTLAVEVLEPDGRTAAVLGGRVLVSPRGETLANTFPLRNGGGTVGWCEWPEGTWCDLRVLMTDGELFTDEFQVRAKSAQPPRRFVRGRGQPPQRVQFPPGSVSLPEANVVVESRDGKLLRPVREFSWLPGQPGGLVATGPHELGLVAFPRDWRRLWVLAPDGTVGEADQEGREPVVGTWRPAQPLGGFDLTAEFRARKVAWACVVFEVEVVTSTGATSWQLADSIQLKAGDEGIPTWRKHMPLGWRGRVRLATESLDEVLTPAR